MFSYSAMDLFFILQDRPKCRNDGLGYDCLFSMREGY